MADYGSYFITIYIETEAIWRRKERNRRREKKIRIRIKSN